MLPSFAARFGVPVTLSCGDARIDLIDDSDVILLFVKVAQGSGLTVSSVVTPPETKPDELAAKLSSSVMVKVGSSL